MNALMIHYIKYQFVRLFLATFILAAGPCVSYALLMNAGPVSFKQYSVGHTDFGPARKD